MGKILVGYLEDPIPDLGSVVEVATALTNHIASPTPHPAYDEPLSLDIYLENGLA